MAIEKTIPQVPTKAVEASAQYDQATNSVLVRIPLSPPKASASGKMDLYATFSVQAPMGSRVLRVFGNAGVKR